MDWWDTKQLHSKLDHLHVVDEFRNAEDSNLASRKLNAFFNEDVDIYDLKFEIE